MVEQNHFIFSQKKYSIYTYHRIFDKIDAQNIRIGAIRKANGRNESKGVRGTVIPEPSSMHPDADAFSAINVQRGTCALQEAVVGRRHSGPPTRLFSGRVLTRVHFLPFPFLRQPKGHVCHCRI